MELLQKKIEEYFGRLSPKERAEFESAEFDKQQPVFPFNKFEYIMSHFLAKGTVKLDEYKNIRSEYLSRNKYLHLFELAPATFGSTWAEKHIKELSDDFSKPDKNLDPNYSRGEYDLMLHGIRVEVKASRVVSKYAGDTLAVKAMSHNSLSDFEMNFQQLKPDLCDVFVWIALWTDKIDYWVISCDDVRNNESFSSQHKTPKQSGNKDVFEGQIHITKSNYLDFNQFKVDKSSIVKKVTEIGEQIRKLDLASGRKVKL